MKGPLTHFPITKTKVPGVTKKFDLTNLTERKEYFETKAGPEIKKIKVPEKLKIEVPKVEVKKEVQKSKGRPKKR